ncbi:unnamed protein product [Dicrocoelium dendriticum]|nr:unnamed protein product [Dicrocoelium dendriticum]
MWLRQGSKACDLIAITETLLRPEISDMEIALPDMSTVRHNLPRKGGGVALYFRNDLQWELIEDSVSTVQDSLWCCLHLKGDDTCLVAGISRPPSSTPEMDCHLASAVRGVINTIYSYIPITGDFNIHALESQATPGEQFKADIQQLVSSYPLYGHINTPTRFREDKPSILDGIFTNDEREVDRRRPHWP